MSSTSMLRPSTGCRRLTTVTLRQLLHYSPETIGATEITLSLFRYLADIETCLDEQSFQVVSLGESVFAPLLPVVNLQGPKNANDDDHDFQHNRKPALVANCLS